MDYTLFYRRSIDPARISKELEVFDIYVSAFNSSQRIQTVFSEVRAKRKIWHIHPEYQYSILEEPVGYPKARPDDTDEIAQVNVLLAEIGDVSGKNICIDVTGFMRHVLIFLVAKLKYKGIREFTAIYSEPVAYANQENTLFSTTTSGRVRPVRGMAGSNHSLGENFLILGVGYDHKLINEVTSNKDNLTVFPVFGFPSLSADMYQQSAVKAAESGAVAYENTWFTNRRFAPASDPFATASILMKIASDVDKSKKLSNIYLSPLSTKAQTLGFALFWLYERDHPRIALTMLLPECLTYSRETSIGLKRLWAYTVELV